MRIKRIALVLAVCGLPFALAAQEKVDIAALNAAIETQRQMTEAQRQQIVSQNLELTGEESADFWPLYREYRADVAKLNDRFVKLIVEFGENYETLTDEQATRLSRDALKLDADRVKLKQRYFSRFARIIPGRKVARYMQIEVRLDTIMDLKTQSAIPLAM